MNSNRCLSTLFICLEGSACPWWFSPISYFPFCFWWEDSYLLGVKWWLSSLSSIPRVKNVISSGIALLSRQQLEVLIFIFLYKFIQISSWETAPISTFLMCLQKKRVACWDTKLYGNDIINFNTSDILLCLFLFIYIIWYFLWHKHKIMLTILSCFNPWMSFLT